MDYTPTTEEIRHGYVGKQAVCINHGDWITKDQWAEFGAEFDRWLAEVKAQAWEEGQSSMKKVLSVWPKQHHLPINPYRQGENK